MKKSIEREKYAGKITLNKNNLFFEYIDSYINIEISLYLKVYFESNSRRLIFFENE